jgi:hypothetical protein
LKVIKDLQIILRKRANLRQLPKNNLPLDLTGERKPGRNGNAKLGILFFGSYLRDDPYYKE